MSLYKNYDSNNVLDNNGVSPELWMICRLCNQFMWERQLVLEG